MTAKAIRLKYLLAQHHWQTYRTFCAEYDKAARLVDPTLVGTWPSRAQLHRWLVGELKGLPYPDHCRVLEKLFPGWAAVELFELVSPSEAIAMASNVSLSPDQSEMTADELGDLNVFVDLNEEDNRSIAQRIKTARTIFFAAHTGYNAMVSQYQGAIRHAISEGCSLRVVVSDPEGPLMKQEELTQRLCPSIRQEGEIRDVLAACARHRLHAGNTGHDQDNVQAATYTGVPSANMFMVDSWLRIIPYLPLIDAAESPVFEYIFDRDSPSPIVAKYLLSMERLWADSDAVNLDSLKV